MGKRIAPVDRLSAIKAGVGLTVRGHVERAAAPDQIVTDPWATIGVILPHEMATKGLAKKVVDAVDGFHGRRLTLLAEWPDGWVPSPHPLVTSGDPGVLRPTYRLSYPAVNPAGCYAGHASVQINRVEVECDARDLSVEIVVHEGEVECQWNRETRFIEITGGGLTLSAPIYGDRPTSAMASRVQNAIEALVEHARTVGGS